MGLGMGDEGAGVMSRFGAAILGLGLMLSRDQPTLGLGPVWGFLACLRPWLLMSSWLALEGGGLCLLPGTLWCPLWCPFLGISEAEKA